MLKAISTVTLSSWSNKKMAEAFFVPQLLALVHEAPHDLERRLWLGLRLREMEVTKDRIKRSIAPSSATGLILRPIVRPLTAGAVRALRSDNTAPSLKVLVPAFDAAVGRIRANPIDPRTLAVIARLYHLAGAPRKAMEVGSVAAQARDASPLVCVAVAEAAMDLGDADAAWRWATAAASRGSTIGTALLRPDTARRRAQMQSNARNYVRVPGTDHFWKTKAAYFAGADAAEIVSYIGPSLLAA